MPELRKARFSCGAENAKIIHATAVGVLKDSYIFYEHTLRSVENSLKTLKEHEKKRPYFKIFKHFLWDELRK